jgi:hypothetical protein
MKLFLKENILSIEHLTPGRFYDGELTPTMYDPVTLQPDLPRFGACRSGGFHGRNCQPTTKAP